jgi:hypothetical protein
MVGVVWFLPCIVVVLECDGGKGCVLCRRDRLPVCGSLGWLTSGWGIMMRARAVMRVRAVMMVVQRMQRLHGREKRARLLIT